MLKAHKQEKDINNGNEKNIIGGKNSGDVQKIKVLIFRLLFNFKFMQ